MPVSVGQAIGVVTIVADVDKAASQIASFSQQLVDFAVAADKMATAFARQMVAAENLAGSQAKLNSLLGAYAEATGGAVDKAQALANVTKDISLGFADNALQLSQFAEAARGISLAGFGGGDQAAVEGELQGAIVTQRRNSLRQLGLEYDQVKARANELMRSESDLTQQQAYGQAVIEQANAKFGDLAKSAEGAKTGLENAAVAWANFRLKVGESTKGDVNEIANWFAEAIDAMGKFIEESKKTEDQYRQITQDMRNDNQQQGGFWNELLNRFLLAPPGQFGQNVTGPQFRQPPPPWMTSATGNANPTRIPSTGPSDEQQTAISDWWTKREQIETKMGQSLNDENARYEQQRLDSETNYQEQVTQSASSFAKQRMRAQEDYERSIVDIMRAAQQRDAQMAADHDRQVATMQRDSAQRIGKLDEQLNRTIAQQRADSAERLAGFATDRDKTIEQDRKDSTKRLVQIEQDYNDQRQQAARAHANAIFDAAASADGRALFMEQRRYAQEQDDAAKSHNQKVTNENDKLQESIDNVNNAYDEKVAAEKKSLEKSIQQAQEAHDRQVKDEQDALQQRINDANDAYTRQLADAHDADTQRITDMAANFALQKKREDEDQTDRMNQMATHHTEEMTQFNTEHNQRVGQIIDHAKNEREQLDTEFQKQLTALGIHNLAWDKAQDDHNTEALRQQKLFYDEQTKAFLQSSIIQATAQMLLPGADIGTLSKAIEGFNTLLKTTNDDIDNLIGKAPTVDASSVVSASSIVGAAVVSAGALPTAVGGGLSVTFAQGAVQIYGVSGQTANDLADIIDKRILTAVQTAAGRL